MNQSSSRRQTIHFTIPLLCHFLVSKLIPAFLPATAYLPWSYWRSMTARFKGSRSKYLTVTSWIFKFMFVSYLAIVFLATFVEQLCSEINFRLIHVPYTKYFTLFSQCLSATRLSWETSVVLQLLCILVSLLFFWLFSSEVTVVSPAHQCLNVNC